VKDGTMKKWTHHGALACTVVLGKSIRPKEGFMKSISIAGDLLFPSDEEILWLVEHYDLVIEEICEATANPPACNVYFKPNGRITEYLSFLDWGWKRGQPLV